MRLFGFKYKDIKGNENTYDIGVEGPNVVQDSTHRFVSDEEKRAWNSKPGSSDSVKENTVEFTTAATRANIVSGETLKVMMGKIHKVILDIATVAFSGSYNDLSNKPTIPSGAAASYAVANNDTTTAAGYVADARIVRTHGLEIDQLSSDLNAMNDNGAITGMDAREDGVYITYVPADGADAVTRKLGEPTLIASGLVSAATKTLDCTTISGYKNLTADNFLLQCVSIYHGGTYNGENFNTVIGSLSKNYNAETGILTIGKNYYVIYDASGNQRICSVKYNVLLI